MNGRQKRLLSLMRYHDSHLFTQEYGMEEPRHPPAKKRKKEDTANKPLTTCKKTALFFLVRKRCDMVCWG
jgi:hypothetical protein